MTDMGLGALFKLQKLHLPQNPYRTRNPGSAESACRNPNELSETRKRSGGHCLGGANSVPGFRVLSWGGEGPKKENFIAHGRKWSTNDPIVSKSGNMTHNPIFFVVSNFGAISHTSGHGQFPIFWPFLSSIFQEDRHCFFGQKGLCPFQAQSPFFF